MLIFRTKYRRLMVGSSVLESGPMTCHPNLVRLATGWKGKPSLSAWRWLYWTSRIKSIGPARCANSMSLRWSDDFNHVRLRLSTFIIVWSSSWASMGKVTFPFSGEIQNLTLRLLLWLMRSPPTTAMSILFCFSCRPRSRAKYFRITVVPAPLSMRTLPSRTPPLADLNLIVTTGMMLSLSGADVAELSGSVGGSECNSRWWKREQPFLPHFTFDLQSLVTWPLFKHEKHKRWSFTCWILWSVVQLEKVGHSRTRCSSEQT